MCGCFGFMSFRHGGYPPNLSDKEVADMNSYVSLEDVIGIIGLVLSAIIVGITIAKNNRR